ncbi:MAG: HTTM domain-containing protein [Verrucomicrobiae bacterium]|nr:HTTM domain-containing protein [Verrucomicrobiae bacterium]
MATDHAAGFLDRLNRPIPLDSLAAFRVLFGITMCVAMLRTLARGWVDTIYLEPAFHFSYPGFAWVKPLPASLMYPIVAGTAVAALAVAAGFFYRIAAVIFLLGFLYLELIDRAAYLNHYYLVTLLALLLCFLPAHRRWSWDATVGRVTETTVGAVWPILLLRFQLGVVYVFAALAKLNADWLLHAQPLRIWLPARSELPWVGPLLAHTITAHVFSWFGFLYDLTIVIFLMRTRTRPFAYAVVVVFHVLTAVLFPIGMFPWIMIVATTVFFPPDWPRIYAGTPVPEVPQFPRLNRIQTVAIAGFCFAQVLIPMRSWFIPGDSFWTGEGFDFGWRVMVAEKTGMADFTVIHRETGRRTRIRNEDFLTAGQERAMTQSPGMIRQFALHLDRIFESPGGDAYAVIVDAYATMNGRRSQRLIREGVDLTRPLPRDWIVPLAASPTRLSAGLPRVE